MSLKLYNEILASPHHLRKNSMLIDNKNLKNYDYVNGKKQLVTFLKAIS